MCLLDQVSSSLSKKHEWPIVALDGWGKSFSESEVEANGFAYGEVQLSYLTTTRYEYIQEKYKSIVPLSNDAKH